MVGERTQKKYRLGDEVEVLLVRANVEERNLDFVLKDNGAYDPEAMKNAVKGGRKPGKPAGKKDGDKQGGRGRSHGGHRGGKSTGNSLADAFAAAKERKEGKNTHGRRRGASGEKLSHRPPEGRHAGSPKRGRQEGSKERELRSRMRKDFGGAPKREREQGDYHHVHVTGLNSAVWPDPPGYHEKRHDEEKQEKPRKAPRRGFSGHRKTEGGTGNAK